MQTQRMYIDHRPRPATVAVSENLADRVLRIGKTIMDLRRRLAAEKEMLKREKMMTASMYLLPTTNEYYTLVTPRADGENPQTHRQGKLHPEQLYRDGETYQRYDGHAPVDNILDNMTLTRSEKNLIERERKMAMMSSVHAYRKHLKAVENKCKYELGAVKDSICNLRRVSTEMQLEIVHGQHRNPEDEKDFFYD